MRLQSVCAISVHCGYQYLFGLVRINAVTQKPFVKIRGKLLLIFFLFSLPEHCIKYLSLFCSVTKNSHPNITFLYQIASHAFPFSLYSYFLYISLWVPLPDVQYLHSKAFLSTMNSCLRRGITKIVTMDTLPSREREWPFPSSKRSNYLLTLKTGDHIKRQSEGIGPKLFIRQVEKGSGLPYSAGMIS